MYEAAEVLLVLRSHCRPTAELIHRCCSQSCAPLEFDLAKGDNPKIKAPDEIDSENDSVTAVSDEK